MKSVREFLATCFYVGHVPGAPGTYASILAVCAFLTAGDAAFRAGWFAFLGIVLVSMFALSRAEETFGSADPKPAVLDEFAGMWLSMLLCGSTAWLPLCVAFAAFRLLDVLKPWPIRALERFAGWRGIIADDLAAGLVSGGAARLIVVYVLSH